ncbi:MAG: SpoIIIAC/SpoIIIAD family protein [Eubacteriales bacterium]|nr:SpoIIIAC/SpoIIIAD family protein [Eubacteriales bacterium]MDD4421976.1 SpoIIIAC/SpoIIIAD family protein [Eubacteriales bacterium]
MDTLTVCAFSLVSLCVLVLVRQLRQELVPLTVAAIGIIMLGYLLVSLAPVLSFISDTAEQSGLGGYFKVLVKALAIALSCQVCAEICRDCGESSLASKVELAGKIGIIILSLPILQQLLTMAKEMLA